MGKYRPTTADNILLPNLGFKGWSSLRDGAHWHIDGVKDRFEHVIRDRFDFNPKLVENIQFCHRNFDYAEIATDSNE